MNYWHMQQFGWISRELKKKSNPKILHTVWFHRHNTLKWQNFRLLVAKIRDSGGWWSIIGGGCSYNFYKQATQGTLVVMEMFCILAVVENSGTYAYNKIAWNWIHIQVQVKLGKSE